MSHSSSGTACIHLSIIKWIIPIYIYCPTPLIVILCCCVKGTWVKELKHETAFKGLVSSVRERIDESSKLEFQKSCQERIYPFWKMARAGMK